MDRQLLERMIGAGVLIAALILIVPVILDGQRDEDSEAISTADTGSMPVESEEPARTHTMLLDRPPERPPVARETPLPTADEPPEPEQQSAAAPESASPSPADVEPKPGVQDEAVSPPKEVQPEKPLPAVKPARPAETPRPAAADPPAEKFSQIPDSGWSVQLGSFADKQNAERLATTISESGFATYLMPLRRSDQTLYRVRVGPRDSRAQATVLADRLAKAGFKGQVIEQRPDS